jgi:hypothetical protein
MERYLNLEHDNTGFPRYSRGLLSRDIYRNHQFMHKIVFPLVIGSFPLFSDPQIVKNTNSESHERYNFIKFNVMHRFKVKPNLVFLRRNFL